jgi:hypothetical protein
VTATPIVTQASDNTSSNSILRDEFLKLQTWSGANFTLDACAADDGHNALCDNFCSPSRSFLDADLQNNHVWLNAPFDILQECVCHYWQQKQLYPDKLSACIVVPSAAIHGSLGPVLRKMKLLNH